MGLVSLLIVTTATNKLCEDSTCLLLIHLAAGLAPSFWKWSALTPQHFVFCLRFSVLTSQCHPYFGLSSILAPFQEEERLCMAPHSPCSLHWRILTLPLQA